MKGRVLVVDGSYDTLVALATALRARNHHVALATDGRSGLQHAVETSAEVVLVDRDLPVLDVRTFLEVLRDNPRTSDAHVFIMGEGDPARLSAIDALAEPIVKPFNAEEIARRVHEVIQRRRAPRGTDDLKGDLSQVALFDLLQVFSQNRRTGKLEVHTPGGVGAIWLSEGRIMDAVFGLAMGEKAVYRVLALREGRFLFQPEVRSPSQRISLPVDHLLMEAVRRVDESVRVRSELPALTALVYERSEEGPDDPVVAAIRKHLDEPRSIEELLDLVPGHDLETLKAILALQAADAIEIDASQGQVAFCAEHEVAAMRAAAIRLRRAGGEGAVRLGVIARSGEDVLRFSRALQSVREFVAAADGTEPAGDALLGVLGTIRFGGTDLELFVLPHEPTYRPLYGAVLATARVAMLLGVKPADASLRDLCETLDLRLVHVPRGFEYASGATFAVREALGTLPTGPGEYTPASGIKHL
ncbi:MAG: DUF4388 domain-containing protein [Myxococcales bacterium]|nr:DUF4388 domain-containing protein [Myxococcales bacterium]